MASVVRDSENQKAKGKKRKAKVAAAAARVDWLRGFCEGVRACSLASLVLFEESRVARRLKRLEIGCEAVASTCLGLVSFWKEEGFTAEARRRGGIRMKKPTKKKSGKEEVCLRHGREDCLDCSIPESAYVPGLRPGPVREAGTPTEPAGRKSVVKEAAEELKRQQGWYGERLL